MLALDESESTPDTKLLLQNQEFFMTEWTSMPQI